MAERVFADTFHWVALEDPRDQWHGQAQVLTGQFERTGLTTSEAVLSEVMTWFAGHGPYWRRRVVQFVRTLMAHPLIEVIPQTTGLFEQSIDFFERRPDKSYSLADCSSMTIMRQLGIVDVLSRDHHFEQEGFQLLYAALV